MQMGMAMGQKMEEQTQKGSKTPNENTEDSSSGETTPKFCPNCGAKNDGSKFCPNCGHKLK